VTKKFPLTNWSEKKAFTIKLGAVKKYHIAVFADPNCPWCKRFFEENTDKLNDLEIFVYLAPVLGEDSEKLAAEILSEKDPAAAWTDWVMNENRPKVKVTEEAKNTVEDNMELLGGHSYFSVDQPQDFSLKVLYSAASRLRDG
jgi:thiol:disulfide interchange protein DsbC